MHYKVKKRKTGGWSLRAWGSGHTRYVPQEAWPAGLSPDDSIEKARTYVKSLNAVTRMAAEEAKRQGSLSAARRRRRLQHALLPATAVSQFEMTYLGKSAPVKRVAIWQTAQRVIVEMAIEPRLWALSSEAIYAWFSGEGYSFDFAKRVVAALNRYGYIYGLLVDRAYPPIPEATPSQRAAIDDAQEEHRRASPFSPAELAVLQAKLPPGQAAWLGAAFWFGLRPEETDQLVRPAPTTPRLKLPRWSIEGAVLAVYQPKLRAVREAERFKKVPLTYPQQKEALLALRKAELKRPHRRRYPKGFSAYSCRHGFAIWLQEQRVDRQTISEWLGHRSLQTTEQYYLRLGEVVRHRLG